MEWKWGIVWPAGHGYSRLCNDVTNSFSKITGFKVGKYYPWLSDHCPLFYTIAHTKGMKPKTEEDGKLNILPLRCRWTPPIKNSFVRGLQTQNVKKEFDDLVRENCTSGECIWGFSKTLLKYVNVERKTKRENAYPKEIIYDGLVKNVKILKKELKKLSKKIRQKC